MEDYNSRHTGPVIDDAVDRAKIGGAIDESLLEKASLVDGAVPPEAGGTGEKTIGEARAAFGIGVEVVVSVGTTGAITVGRNSVYLIVASNNANRGALLCSYGSSGSLYITELVAPSGWSYSSEANSSVLTIIPNVAYGTTLNVTTLRSSYNVPYTGG